MSNYSPTYLELYKTGELKRREEILKEKLKCCEVCPHCCKVNRIEGSRGFCGAAHKVVVDGYSPHFGEENVLVGTHGSGTIFFTHCVMKCVFCQNYEISQCGEGKEISTEDLSEIMLLLQKRGCHNINLVSPTHYVPQIIESINIAAGKGLTVPIVYNTGGYDNVKTLEVLDGIIDIYMPDMKFGDNELAKKYTKVNKYFDVVKSAVKEMYRQVGDLRTNKGIAYRGLLIRHLVMPNLLENTYKVLDFIANEISKNTVVNIMAQYYPTYRAYNFPEISRKITKDEYKKAIQYAKNIGLKRLITL